LKPRAVAFDMIGTTFSLEPVREPLRRLGLGEEGLETWFATGLRDAFALAATGGFSPFTKVLEGALDQLLAAKSLPEGEDRADVFEALKTLSPYDDAHEAFSTVKDAGISVVALTNGSRSSTRKLLDRSGLDAFVDRIVSVEEVQTFKPKRDVYLHTAAEAGALPEELMLVAAHGWDVHGAKSAGLMAGFVTRGQPFPAFMRAPDIMGESLLAVCRQLV